MVTTFKDLCMCIHRIILFIEIFFAVEYVSIGKMIKHSAIDKWPSQLKNSVKEKGGNFGYDIYFCLT